MGWVKRLAAALIPYSERAVVTRELDELYHRRKLKAGAFRADCWFLAQVLAFAFRLRLEAAYTTAAGIGPLYHDLLFSLRMLLRRPAYLAAGVLTLGIGTGGVATVYGAAHWVLLRDVPGVGEPEELVWVRLESTEDWGGMTWGIMNSDLLRMRQRMPSLTAFEASTEEQVHFAIPKGPPPGRLTASMVTPGYFDLLSMRPAIGRFFSPADHQGGSGPAEVVVDYEMWIRFWKGTASALGSEVEINGRPYTVIGVAPRGFQGAELPGQTRLWVPSSAFGDIRPADAERGLDRTPQLWDRLIGRRQPEASVPQVQTEANAAMESIREELHGMDNSFGPTHFIFTAYDGIGLDPWVRPQVRKTLNILGGASLLLLILAIANVANLGLMRASSRRGASAIRRALGAGSWRVAREPLLEGILLGLLGAIAGLALVLVGGAGFSEARLSPRGASLEGMSLGWAVVGVTFLASAVSGGLSGLVPAFMVRRERALHWLKGHDRGGSGTIRTRSLLVVGQVALSGALVVGAGLFARTIQNLNRIDLGFSKDAYTFSVDPALNGHDETTDRQILAQIQDQLRNRFGTAAAGIVYPSPMRGWRITGSLRRQGAPEDQFVLGSTFWTSGNGFFSALGVELIAGEGFDQDLNAPLSGAHPIVINEAMAEAGFPGISPEAVIGRAVTVGGNQFESTVVGVLADARVFSPLTEPGPVIFQEYDTEWSDGVGIFYLRSGFPPGEARGRVVEVVQGVDEALPVYDAGTVGGLADALLVDRRVVARLAGGLGVIGLILVSLGLYGVLSYAVHERTREVGIRAALGASPASLRGEVLRRGLGLTVVGLMVGLPFTWWVTRFVESRLFGVGTLDTRTYGLGVTAMLVVGLISSWLPAQRATRISPVEALREE